MSLISTTYSRLAVSLGIILLTSIVFIACNTEPHDQGKQVLTVSILPQKYFVEKICGDQFNIQVMIPPGENPATYDPTPDKMVQLTRSDIYFLIGHIQFEKTWINDIKKSTKKTSFHNTSEGIEFEESEHQHNDHSHLGIDPHTWMSAPNVKIIAHNMATFLSARYPENSSIYKKNLHRFTAELDSLHNLLKNKLSNLESREFIIYHPALTYFAKDYNLTQIPVEYEGKEPSSQYMKRVIDRAVDSNIKAILIQKQFNTQEAKTIEKEIKGKVILIDPLDYQWAQQMQHIAHELNLILNNRE